MGFSGPPPNRSEERRRRNARTEAGESTEVEKLVVEGDPPYLSAGPPADDWDDIAKDIYTAALSSAQAIYYEPSDIAVLRMLCESISRDMGEQFVALSETTGESIYERIPMKGASLSAYLKGFQALMLLEGDRRRLRLEVERKNAVAEVAKALSGDDIVADRGALFLVKDGHA